MKTLRLLLATTLLAAFTVLAQANDHKDEPKDDHKEKSTHDEGHDKAAKEEPKGDHHEEKKSDDHKDEHKK